MRATLAVLVVLFWVIRINDRPAYQPCDEHARAVRAALPKGCPE